jgi:hypothetical protein
MPDIEHRFQSQQGISPAVAAMASTVPVWTVQAIAAHDAALTMGAYRASPKHLENGDFCNPERCESLG